MEIQQGAVLSLKCRVQGDTDPVIRWYKDGAHIDSATNDRIQIIKAVKRSQLRLRNIQLSDSGNYSCKGESAQNQVGKWVYVTVRSAPDERKVADETAYSPCPVNTCNLGKCILINNQPTCRCPSTHVGPHCTEPVLQTSHSPYLSTVSQTRVPDEEFVLDQSNQEHYRSILDLELNKCDLPEYQYTSECAQVNSHFYAFIGAAIACSVIILLLGSCLGYMRRRKILQQQATNEKPNGQRPFPDANSPKDGHQFHEEYSASTRHDSPIFISCSGSTGQTLCSNLTVGNSLLQPTTPRTYAHMSDMTLSKITASASFDARNQYSQPAYVVLATTSPVALHPLENLPNLSPLNETSSAAGAIHTDRSRWITSAQQSTTGGIPIATSSFTRDIIPVHFLNSPKGTLQSNQSLPIPSPCNAQTDKIYVQIPPIAAPIYLSNNVLPTSTEPATKCLSAGDCNPSDSGVTDIGSELITPLSPINLDTTQSCTPMLNNSPQLKSQLQTLCPRQLKPINPDCIPLLNSSSTDRKLAIPTNATITSPNDPTSLVTFRCSGFADRT